MAGTQPSRATLEICVETVAGLTAAVEGGADRIELCAALSVGGLTPPGSLIGAAARLPLPVHLLARPRAGGFVYTPSEQALVADDIRAASAAGLAGVVIGASAHDHRLDAPVLAQWVALARALGTARGARLSLTLHRAFDLVPDPAAALDTAIALGFDRILTSGGAPRAIDGAATLAALHARAAGRIALMAGSGIDTTMLPAILATGVREVHASARVMQDVSAASPEYRFGFVDRRTGETDATRVAHLAAILRHAS